MDGEQHTESNQALDALFWRDEILQVMYWLQGEGLGEVVSAQDLQVFLDGDLNTIQFYLEQFTDEGYLTRHPDAAEMLNDTRRFADEFTGLQKSGHGECSADCSCHQTGNHDDCPSHQHQH